MKIKPNEAIKKLEEILTFQSQGEILDNPHITELFLSSVREGKETYDELYNAFINYEMRRDIFYSKVRTFYDLTVRGPPNPEDYDGASEWLSAARKKLVGDWTILGSIGTGALAGLVPWTLVVLAPIAACGIYAHITGGAYLDKIESKGHNDTDGGVKYAKELGHYKSLNDIFKVRGHNPSLFSPDYDNLLKTIDQLYEVCINAEIDDNPFINALTKEHEAVRIFSKDYSQIFNILVKHNKGQCPTLGHIGQEYSSSAISIILGEELRSIEKRNKTLTENLSECVNQRITELQDDQTLE